ncbi:hypothetical protein Goshw_001772 [Gossypium schwendimanii]|uniref:Aminotransferase-like plant mobile domain-containing protein n=1 Tax=Gossypium schwendimanii TaxID=34291 RepID=A0A7J9LJE7_GOSSC|nr:hypothetical protein [Gossypium schwendimanii]
MCFMLQEKVKRKLMNYLHICFTKSSSPKCLQSEDNLRTLSYSEVTSITPLIRPDCQSELRGVTSVAGRGGHPRRTHSIFHVGSVPSLWRTCSYSWGYQWMGPYSPGPLNLMIGEPYIKIFWVRFQILFTEVESMGWLRKTFPMLGDDLNEVQRVRYARAYILQIIGGYLMSDKSPNLVHLRWLLKFINLRVVDELSWGSAVLVILYREMCRATQPNKIKIGGCLSLLQS